jgi:hypothetical protein
VGQPPTSSCSLRKTCSSSNNNNKDKRQASKVIELRSSRLFRHPSISGNHGEGGKCRQRCGVFPGFASVPRHRLESQLPATTITYRNHEPCLCCEGAHLFQPPRPPCILRNTDCWVFTHCLFLRQPQRGNAITVLPWGPAIPATASEPTMELLLSC